MIKVSTHNLDLETYIFISFSYVDGEIHELERRWLNDEWDIDEALTNKVISGFTSEKDAIDLFTKCINDFPDDEERKNLLILSLKEMAWADGNLHEAERKAFSVISKVWDLEVSLDSSGWNPSDEQREIIEAPADQWIRVVSKPGTGKTATACARISYLIKNGIDPHRIWMMSFTRTAIKEISSRIKDLSDFNGDDGFGAIPFYGLKISTIDSQAGKIRYGFSDSEAKKLFGSYNKSLSEASEVLRKPENEEEIFSFFKNIKHIVLDEAQDITDERAEFIGNLFLMLDPSCGVTIFEDPAQAIYSGDTYLDKVLENKGLKKEFNKKELSIFHRTGNKSLINFIHEFHDLAGFRMECSKEEYKSMQLNIQSVSSKNLGTFDPQQIKDLENEFKNSLVLFRQRGQVLTASYKISESENEGMYHRIRMGDRKDPIFPWLGYLFWDREKDTIDSKEFGELWDRKSPHPWLENLSADISWELLYQFTPLDNKELIVDLKKLRNKLSSYSPDPRFTNPDLGLWGPILGTVHGSKGREANNVAFFNNSSIPSNKRKRSEEARVMYVAASRQRDSLQLGEGTKGNFLKLDSGRVYSKYRNNIRLEIGKTNDYDELSLVNKNFYESEKMVSGIQGELIRLSDPNLPIPKLQAVRLSEQANYAFEVRLKSYNKYEGLGKFNDNNFKEDLFQASKKVGVMNNTPYLIKTFQLLGCGTGIISSRDERIKALHPPFNKSGMWLYPIVSGIPYLNYW